MTLGVAFIADHIKTTDKFMSSSLPDDLLLLIRCPSCGQRFKVGEDLRERTVECGGCEHRFRINDDVIIRTKKIYPGERQDPSLTRFQRVPLPLVAPPMGQQAMRYLEPPAASVLEPTSPLRVIAGVAGVAVIVLTALLLLFGSGRGGLLDGMALQERLVMVGFVGLMGIVSLVYANPKARWKALSVGLVMCCGLWAIPFRITVADPPPSGQVESVNDAGEVALRKSSEKNDALLALRARIGTDPLDKQIKRLESEGSDKRAIGLWLRGLTEMNRFLVRDYIFRATGADPSSHFYPRDGGDFLMVVIGPRQSLEEFAKVTEALGHTEEIYPELSVIEIRVNNENFSEGPIEKLSNKNDPAFYDLNKRELESIDLERMKRAVQRLGEAEPKIYRSDITRKLIAMLGEEGLDFKGNICHALATWSEIPGPASKAALAEVEKLIEKRLPVHQDMISLIVKEKNKDVIPFLNQLWMQDTLAWEQLYGEVGPAVEATIIGEFQQADGPLRYSAVRLLARVGGTDSLPVLNAAMADANPELRVMLEQAQKTIRERLAR